MIRRRLGWPATDAFVTDDELFNMIRESQKELFDFMVSVHGDGFRMFRVGIVTVANQGTYIIQRDPGGSVGDVVGLAMERLVRVAFFTNNKSIRMRRFDIATDNLDYTPVAWDESTDIQYRFSKGFAEPTSGEQLDWIFEVYPIPAGVYTVEIVCNLGPGTLSLTGALQDLENDEYIILDCAIKCLQMEETDPSVFMGQKDRLIQRLTNEATPLDIGRPMSIQDVRAADEDVRARWWR